MKADALIKIEGMSELVGKITRLEQARSVAGAVQAAAVYVKGKIATYPKERHGKNDLLRERSMNGDRMRRGFFARLKKGLIEVPYRRGSSPGSEALGRSWAVASRNGGFSAVIGNDASYGRLVQDRAVQTLYHIRTGWVTVQGVADTEAGAVSDFVMSALNKELG